MSEETARIWMSQDLPEESVSGMQPELLVLINRASAGDVRAFEQIMLRHERAVLLTARRLLGNNADAEEAAQEVFLRVYKYLHRFDRSRPFEPWLFRMTVNVCRDIALKRPVVSVAPAGPEPTAPAADDPHRCLDGEEQRRLMYSLLCELSDKQRAALVLRDLQGLSTTEVAHSLGISEATVRSHVSAARLRLREFIKRRFGGSK